MHRRDALGLVVLLAVTVLFTGWSRTAAQAGDEGPVTPIGVWDISGVADSSTAWIATLVLSEDENDGILGHIDWLADSGASGREHVVGTFDAETRVLSLNGTRVEYADDVVRCTYRVEMSRDGSRLENGRWTDYDPAVPGTWTAERIRVP